jgi:hypothetical protein
MFFTLLVLAAVLGFFCGPVWLVFFTGIALLFKLLPVAILLAGCGCVVALAVNYFNKRS